MSYNPLTYVYHKAPKPEPVIIYTGAADAIDFTAANIFVLNRSGNVDSATLAAPTANIDDGRTIWILNGTTQANTITVAGGLGGSGGSYDLITFTNVAAANVTLRAYQGAWYLIGQYGATVS